MFVSRTRVIRKQMIQITELRALLVAAQRYLAGTCSIHELNGRAGALADAAKLFDGHSVFHQIANEWSKMIDRRWNECGHVACPLSEEQFRIWLIEQIAFFDAGIRELD